MLRLSVLSFNSTKRRVQSFIYLPGAAAPVLQTDFRTYEARGPGGLSVHKEAHLPLTFPFKNCFEEVHSLNVDIVSYIYKG